LTDIHHLVLLRDERMFVMETMERKKPRPRPFTAEFTAEAMELNQRRPA
jgi:hypothetical protein